MAKRLGTAIDAAASADRQTLSSDRLAAVSDADLLHRGCGSCLVVRVKDGVQHQHQTRLSGAFDRRRPVQQT